MNRVGRFTVMVAGALVGVAALVTAIGLGIQAGAAQGEAVLSAAQLVEIRVGCTGGKKVTNGANCTGSYIEEACPQDEYGNCVDYRGCGDASCTGGPKQSCTVTGDANDTCSCTGFTFCCWGDQNTCLQRTDPEWCSCSGPQTGIAFYTSQTCAPDS